MFSFLLVVMLSVSCKTKENKDATELAKSYGLIYGAFVTSNQVQDNFFGKATELLGQVKYDKDGVVDTKPLEILLDSAKTANNSQIELINMATEPDDDIKYKAKAITFVNILKDLYNNKFPEFISVLNSKTEDRFEKAQQLLYKPMLAMSKAMHDCHDAGEELRKKYNIQDINMEN